jgi:hypothetical protein
MTPASRLLGILILFTVVLAVPAALAVPSAQEPPSPPSGPAAPPQPPAVGTPEEPDDEEPPPTLRRVSGDRFVMGSDIRIGPDEFADGDLVTLGGNIIVEGRVRGETVAIGGRIEVSGTVDGNVVGVVSQVVLRKGAVVKGELVNVGGFYSDEGAEIRGQVVNVGMGGGLADLSAKGAGILGSFFFWLKLVKLLVLFLLLVLLTAIVPERIRLMAEEVPLAYGMALLTGLGGFIVFLLTATLLFFTVIGIPVAIALWFGYVVLKWLGLAAVFVFLGRRLGALAGREMSLLGAVLLGFLLYIGWYLLPSAFGGLFGFLLAVVLKTIFWIFIALPAIGFIILTRVGTRPYAVVLATAPAGGFGPPHPPPPPPPPSPTV